MGGISFSRKKTSSLKKVSLYSFEFEHQPTFVLHYLTGGNLLEPHEVEKYKRIAKGNADDFDRENIRQVEGLDPKAHPTTSEEFNFVHFSVGGRHIHRPLMRHYTKGNVARIFYLNADWKEGMPTPGFYYYDSQPSRIKEAINPQKGHYDFDETEETAEDRRYNSTPLLILCDRLGKAGARFKNTSEVELHCGLNEVNFKWHVQAVDMCNDGEGFQKGLEWLKGILEETSAKK